MATEADIPAEPLSTTKNVGETIYLERLVDETIPGEVKKLQEMLSLSPDTAQYSAGTENKQAGMEPEIMITVVQGSVDSVETAEGKKFFDTPHAVEVADLVTSEVSKHCQDEEAPNQADKEMSEDEKQVSIEKTELADETGRGGNKLLEGSEEILEKNDASSDIVDHPGNGLLKEKIEESNPRNGVEILKVERVVDQHAEDVIDENVSIEDKNIDKEIIEMHKIDKDGIPEATGETGSKEVEYEEAEKSTNFMCQAKSPEAFEPCEKVENEKDEKEISMHDNAGEIFIPRIAEHPDIQSDEEAALKIKEVDAETVYKPSITAATDVSNIHEAGPEAEEKLKEASGVACEEKSQDVTEPSEEMKYMTQVEDEKSQHSIETFATQTEETGLEKIQNPKPFKVPQEIQSDDIIKEDPKECKEEIEVIEKTTEDDSISSEKEKDYVISEQKGDASFMKSEGTLRVNEEVAAADSSSGENRNEEGSAVIVTKDYSDDTEIVNALDHSQEETSKLEERQENLQQNEEEKEKLERSLSVLNGDLTASASTEYTETTACVKDEAPIKIQEESFEEKATDASEHRPNGISDLEERPEDLQVNRPEKEKIEESSSVAAADYSMASATESDETTTCVEGGKLFKSQEESCEEIIKEDLPIHTDIVSKNEIAEKKNIQPFEFNEKIECQQVEVPNTDANGLHVIDPLIKATVENEGKNSDNLSNSEPEGQVQRAIEASMEEDKHIEDATGAHQSGNCTILEHPSTDGGVTTELIPEPRETNVEKLQDVCSTESEEKSEIRNAGESTDQEMQNNEEVCDTVKPELVTESDDAVKSTTEVHSAVYSRDEEVELEIQTESPLETAPALTGEDKSYAEDHNKSNNDTDEEVHDGMNITGRGVPVNQQVMEGVAAYISKESIKQEIDQVTPGNEDKADRLEAENNIEQTLEESNNKCLITASVERVPEDLPTGEMYENSKAKVEAESIDDETSKTIESSGEITATETSLEEKPHITEREEKLEQQFSLTSDKNEAFSSDAVKTPCLVEDEAPPNLEEAPEKKENEKESEEEKNNAKESKITAEEDLLVVTETSDATISTESLASKLKSEVDNVVIEDKIFKEESKEIHEESKDAGKDVENEKHSTVEEFGTRSILSEPIGEKILLSSAEYEKEEEMPKIEGFAQLETTSIHEDTKKQTSKEENIVDQSSELNVKETEQSFSEDQVIACISLQSVEQETVKISRENSIKQTPEETNITGHIPELAKEVSSKNTEDNEKKAEILESSKMEETAELIENETSSTVAYPKEILDTTQGKQGENVQREEKNITATVSSPEEKLQENELGDKLERTSSLMSGPKESFSSDDNKIRCPVEEGASQYLEEAPQNEGKETKKNNSKEEKIAIEEDLQVLDETTEASKSKIGSAALELHSERENITVEEEIKKEESKEFEDLKDTEKDEETEKHDSLPIGEKVLQSFEEDKKEEETPKFEASTQLETTSRDEDAEKKTLKEESIIDQSREVEVEKIKQSSIEEETSRIEACSPLETTSLDEAVGEKDLEKENIVEQSRELETEKIEESSKEDNTVDNVSSGFIEQDTVKISQVSENKAEESEGDNIREQIVSVEQDPFDDRENEEKQKEETTGENFEDFKTVETAESTENETSKTTESRKEILDTIQEKQDEHLRSERQNTAATKSTPEEKPQKNESEEKVDQSFSLISDENETLSSGGDKRPCLMEEEEVPQNLEEVPEKGENEKESEENNNAKEDKIAAEEDLQVVAETSDATGSTNIIASELKSEMDNVLTEDEILKEESKELSEDCTEAGKDEDNEECNIVEEFCTKDISPETTGEKILKSFEEDEKEEKTPKIEACAQPETIGLHQDTEKQAPEKENIADHSSELEVEKIEQNSNEDHAVACISSESVVQEMVKISGEKSGEQIVEETNIIGQLPESVEQIPFKNTEDNEKKAEDCTAEIIENFKTKEESESIENETRRTIAYPKENVESEGKNITATESSPEEKSQENESVEKIERTLFLVSSESESFTSDANEIHCMVEEGASHNLEVAQEKETEESSDTKENEIAMKEDLQVLDETTEASRSIIGSAALGLQTEREIIAVEDEIKKEESKESKDLEDTEMDEGTEKHDSVEECSTTTILPEPTGEKKLGSEVDKKEEETPFVTSAQLATTGVHDDAENQTLEEESTVDQSGELEVEKIEHSSREEETPRIEACSQHETTSVDEDAGEKYQQKEIKVEQSRELEIEKLEESSKEDSTVAYISSGSIEQNTVKISEGDENKVEELEGESNIEQIVEESSSRNLILESVQQIPIDNSVNEENKAEETTRENFENSKTVEATESIENETSITVESPKEILENIQEKQDESMQSEGKSPAATASVPEEKQQKSELSLVSDENETVSSDGDKIPCLMEEAPQNLEEVPKKEAKDNNDIDDSKITIEEDLEVVTETSSEGNSREDIVLKPKSEVDNIVIENELKKEESKQLHEDCKDGVDEKHDKMEECSTTNILPEPLGEKVLQSSEEDEKEEETPTFEACAQLETISVYEDAEKQILNKERIIDQSREHEVEKNEQSSREEETPGVEACSQHETTNIDEDAVEKDLEKKNIFDQYGEPEIEKIEKSSKEENTLAYISSESIEQETVEVSQINKNNVENSGENNMEQFIEDSPIRGLIPESVQQVPVNNLVDEEKKAEETSVETFQSSNKEEAADIIAYETSETIESPKEIVDTFQVIQVESLLSERKNETATESSQEQKINEDRSPVTVAEENKNDKELVNNTEGEDNMEQCSKNNEGGEDHAFSSDVEKISPLIEEGVSQNRREGQEKEESEKETEENNNTEDNKIPKEEDLQVADEKSDAIKSSDSITLAQNLEVENMEVEDEIKKKIYKELYQDCKDAGKDKETEIQDIMEECSSTNVLLGTIEEKKLHSSEQDKKEEETSKIEGCIPLETTTGDEDAEKQTLNENIVEQSREIDVKLEHISKEGDMAAMVSEQKGCEVAQTVDEDEDAGKRNIVAEAVNKSEASEAADSIPSRENQDVEEDNKQGFLCSSVVEETEEESSQEDECKAVKLKEEVDESNSSFIEKTEATNSTEETVSETLNDSIESNADSCPSNITKASEEETPPKEMHGCTIENSSMVLDVSGQDKEEEIAAKEEINIAAIDSATVTVVTEEICLQEAEPEDKKQVECFGPAFEEKNMVETEAKEIMLENVDTNVKPEDRSNLVQKSEKEIPPAADQASEEIYQQTENEVPHAGSEDQKEMTTNEVSVKEISKEVEYSTVTSEENELMTSNASETTDEIIAESQAPYGKTETPSVSQAIDTMVMEKQDRTTYLSNISDLEPVDTGKKTADEEVQQERVQDLYVRPELDNEKSLSVSEHVQTLKTDETTEIVDHSDSYTTKTLKDVESSHLTPNMEKTENENPFDDAMKSTEISDVCRESEKTFVEQEILKGSSEKVIEVEKAATELKEEAHSQRQEDIDTNDGGTQKQEIFMSAGPEEKLQQFSDVVVGDQSNVIVPESDKSDIEEHCSGKQIQEDEKEIKEKDEPKLELEDQKEQNANETKEAVIITEKVHEGVEKYDDCEGIKEIVVVEKHGFNEPDASSSAGELTDKVQESSLVYNKVEESKEKTEIEIKEVEEVSTKEREAFFVEQPEEQKVQESSIEPPRKDSKEKIEEVIEESQECYGKAENETPKKATETSPGEAELGDKLGKAFHTDLDEPCLETTEFVHSQQGKEVDSIKLEETPCDLTSELQAKGNGHTEGESIITEMTDMGEPEEIKTASEAVCESDGQGSKATDFGKSQTVEKPDQVSTNDHDHAERKNVAMENSDTAVVDETKMALDAVGRTQDQGSGGADETGESTAGISMDRVISSNFEHSEEDSLALESPNSIEFNETNVVSDAIDESKDQGSEASAGENLGVEKLDQVLATNSQEAEKEKVTEDEEPVADEVVETKLSSDVIYHFKDQGIDETGKSPTGKQLDVDKSEEGCTETTDNKVHGLETVTEDEIISEQMPSAENLEQLPAPASELPLKDEITTTVVKIEEEKTETMEMPKDEGSEISSTAKPTEEINLQNDGPTELEVPRLGSNNKDIQESPTEVLVHEEGSQTSDDAIQLEPTETEKVKCVESGESLTAEKPDESKEACKETSDHRAGGVEPATEGEITAEQTPLTEKLEEQLLTPISALPLIHGTTTTVEKIKEEKTEKLETLEDEVPEDSSAAKQTEEMSLLKDSPRELEVLTLKSTSNKDIKECPAEVYEQYEEVGQTPDGAPQVESSGNETKIECADASSESKEIKDLTRPTETACNFKFETSEKDLEPGKTYRTTKTTEERIQADGLSVETLKATASENIGKEVLAEDRTVEDSDQVLLGNKIIKESFTQDFQIKYVDDSATELESRNQGEESNFRSGKSENTAIRDEQESSIEISQKECIMEFEEERKLIQETQKSGKISSAATEEQISAEADTIKRSGTIVSSGNEYVPPVFQERLAETSRKVEAEDLKPGNSEGVHLEVKEIEHGGEKRIDGTEEQTSDKSTLAGSDKPLLSDFSQMSTKETLQLAKDVTKEREPTAGTEERHSEEAETITLKEEKSYEEKDEAEGDENQKIDSGSDGPVMVEASRDMDVKVVHKKSHGILSGVGSKVKHSISKVKKAITGKSSHHPKPVSPK